MSVIWSGITEEGAVVPVQVTEEGKVVAVGDGPEGDYLKLTGGNLTGDLTINEQIELNTDGSATFHGNIRTPRILGIGPTATDKVWSGYLTDTSGAATSFITADGSATFAGQFDLAGKATFFANGEVQLATNNVNIQPDGSAQFAGIISQGNADFSVTSSSVNATQISPGGFSANRWYDNAFVFRGCNRDASSPTSEILANGSATFAGDACGFTTAGELYFTSRNTRYRLVVQNELCVAEPYTREMELKEKKDQFIADKRETKPAQPGISPDIDNSSLKQD